MRMRAGSAEVGGLVEVVEWDERCDMAWSSVNGIDQRGRWRLREQEDGTTKVTLRLAYQAPGRPARHDFRPGVRAHGAWQPRARSLKNLKAMIEGEEMSSKGDGFNPLAFVEQAAETARVAVTSGLARPSRPDKAARALRSFLRLGLDARRRLHDARDPPAERAGDHRRARHADVRRGPRAHQRARQRLARRRPRRGRRHRDHVPQPPRLHRGDRRGVEDRRPRPLPEHRLRRPAAHRGRPAREAGRDRLRPGVRRAARGRGQAPQALHRLGRRRLPARPHARGADRVGRHRGTRASRRARPRRDPHVGYHGHAEGRLAQRRPTASARRSRSCRASRSRRASAR